MNGLLIVMGILQLCATGTVGVAAIGLAFGYRQHSTEIRPSSNKRKGTSFTTSREPNATAMPPATPTALPQSASAPTTRLRKQNSAGRPLSSSNRCENARWPPVSTPNMRASQERDWRQEILGENSRPPTNHANSVFEFKGNGTAKSSWLRRMSTLSSSRNASPMSTSMPASPSMSYSNGSTAPILPEFADANPVIPHRNRLVKRSTSHRALSSTTMHSTLRRPATSHQRSATLQQQYQQDERPALHATPRSSMLFHDVQEEDISSDESTQSWQYFFRTKNIRLGKDGSSRARSAHRNESLKAIVPDCSELPTLLLATSITPRSTRDATRLNEPSDFDDYTPSTPAGPVDEVEMPWTTDTSGKSKDPANTDADPRPRRSFSIADMFPSPSPSTWKMPRSGSMKRARGSVGVSSGRRVVSAPQPTKLGRTRGLSHGKASYGHLGRSKPTSTDDLDPPPVSVDPINTYGRAASSPLPPLNRLSAFEIDLPGAAPSYPTTPQSEKPFSSPRLSTPPSPSMSSPLAPFSNRIRSQHPSLAISDKGSTLLGSDNDNSRMLSGDEDDADFRSETVYDSTRTGATGSSHSNLRRLPIETMFDDPLIADHHKTKAVALQELLSHDSFNTVEVQRNRIAEEEESIPTPVRPPLPTKDNVVLHPSCDTDSPSLARIEPLAPDPQSSEDPVAQVQDISDEEVWAIESLSDSEKNSYQGRRTSSESIIRASKTSSNTVSNEMRPPELTPLPGRVSHPNVTKWSESPPVERIASAPRPNTIQGKDVRGSRTTGRRGPSSAHLRSQSVPVAPENPNHRANTSKLEAWVLGNKGVSEDWDGDFEFEDNLASPRQAPVEDGPIRTSVSSGMLVPRSIMERQASVHGQFGHVKELTLLVEELKILRQQASDLNVTNGLSAELWKEADGIINLATLDDEELDFLSPRSPHSPGIDFDPFEEDSPAAANRRQSAASSSREHANGASDHNHGHTTPAHSTPERSRLDSAQTIRPRKESVAKAKSVLETIHQQRNHYGPNFLDEQTPQKKLPFDTTSLRDLVTRAGVVTRALKEIVRRAEKAAESNPSWTPPNPSPDDDDDSPPPNPPSKPDPPFSQIFHPPNSPTPKNKSPRVTQSPKSSSNSYRGGASIAANDNEIHGHMKIMTVV
ncbi:MAG: hypothetical protein LQ337_006398 [Flavoplaca oasis]|nr:MAG: hypothetical protein LQ337_006398 [Flavoplaca oasis]